MFSCTNCEAITSVWKKLAEQFNDDEKSEIAVAQADCTTEYEGICWGKKYDKEIYCNAMFYLISRYISKIFLKDFGNLYRVSNNGKTSQTQPEVYEMFVFSDQDCDKEIVSMYVNESGNTPGYDMGASMTVWGDGSYAFDKDSKTYWRPQCETCKKSEAWITFQTHESAGCVRAPGLGEMISYMCFGATCWNSGIAVELKMADGTWSSVMTSDKGNVAVGGIQTGP